MSETEILTWFSNLWPGPVARSSNWLFGFAEIIHFIGLCLLFGALLIIDGRLLGFFRNVPAKVVLPLTTWAVIGFLLLLASGWTFFTCTPPVYWGNPAFKVKMLAILLAGINALWFTVVEHRHVAAIGPGKDTPAQSKGLAVLSLSLWFTALVLGRLLPVFTISQN
jgi:hypothetical protein